jgi:hypothetical protein
MPQTWRLLAQNISRILDIAQSRCYLLKQCCMDRFLLTETLPESLIALKVLFCAK